MLQYLYDDINQVLLDLRANVKEGLSDFESQNRLKKYGLNKIQKGKQTPLILKYLKQYTDLLAVILLGATFFSVLLGELRDALIIFLVVVVNATIGFIQEYKAERAIEALKKHLPQTTSVLREKDKKTIPIEEIVPGDIVLLSEGVKVPADIRLISANELFTNDATLTGESDPQTKKALAKESPDTGISDILGTIFAGTEVVRGNGIGIVIATGMNTQLGKIAKSTIEQKESKSPLQLETDHIAKSVAKAVFWVVLILIGIYSAIQGKFVLREAFEFAIGVSASLVPEGLPATVSIALAIGVQKMARRKAIMRRLSAVETLGEANVIVTDKTGTLTKNQMTVKEIFYSGEKYHIKGTGYALSGEITCEGKLCDSKCIESLSPLFLPAIYANDAEVDTKNHGGVEYSGDSTELALLVAAEKTGFDTFEMRQAMIPTEEIPFTSERKFMGKLIKGDKQEIVYIKGAPNIIIEKSNRIFENGKIRKLTDHDKKVITQVNDDFSKEALRVIAVAYKEKDGRPIDEGLIFVGLFGIIDPPREDVAETIRIAKNAGVRAIMVTGDYGLTAAAIAKRIKLNENPEIITGDMMNKLSDHELEEELKKEDILFSRVDPIHKFRIVQTLQKMGNIVAVTGDGVNDAPALKKSDIGVAMGISGTDVSKEAAEMISTNDSFSSIVWAIKEGRIVYENIKKTTKFVFTSNIAEFVAVALGLIIGISPIFAIQILLVDLGAEVFPALALAGDPEGDDLMNRPPRSKKDILFGPETVYYIIRSGTMMGLLSTIAFVIYGSLSGWHFGEKFANESVYLSATTVTYATIAVCQYVNSISIRSKTEPFWKLILGNKRLLVFLGISIVFINSMIYVPFLQNFSYMHGIGLREWGIALFFGAFFLIYLELMKKLNHEPKRLTRLITTKIIESET